MALKYHEKPKPGKLAIIPTKPALTASHLSLAYSPGVAEPCKEIAKKPINAYRYTSKGNLVGVISNGTAVLGLGNIGALASKPVMEGKALLLKRFAGVDSIDIEIDEQDPKELVKTIRRLEPTFGAINLEDIKAPECFYVEEQLIKKATIPIFHDDQHGTAIVIAAGLHNALEITKKELAKTKIVFSGAGAAALASANLLLSLGAKKRNIFLFDSKGLVTTKSANNPYKKAFAQKKSCTLEEALTDADIFIGVSVANLLKEKHLRVMAPKPIIFAMANPDPEVTPKVAKKIRPDCIIGTGRSDHPNQVNNTLCFPFLFRGALDVRAAKITDGMKHAAVKAIADIAKKPVPASVTRAYGKRFRFGPDYIIPKPFDQRLLPQVAAAVAQAAIKDGVALKKTLNVQNYKAHLRRKAARLAKGIFS